MNASELERAFSRLAELSYPRQAYCVARAAQQAWPTWARRCERLGHSDPAPAMFDRFTQWLGGDCTDADLAAAGEALQDLVPDDIGSDPDPPGSFAGWALRDVPVVALGLADDLHDDIVWTAVLYSAASACGRGADATALEIDALTEQEVAFLEDWWLQCCQRVPELR